MSVALNLTLVAASVAGLLAMMAGVAWLGRRAGLSAELQRKCVHVATGLYALSLPLTFAERWPVMLLIAVALVVMLALRLPRFAVAGMGAAVHGVARKSYGELFLALSVGFLFFFSSGEPVLYVLPIAVLTLSDAAAALTGTRYGRRHFQVEAGTKTWEGVVMFFLVTWILAMVLLLLMTGIERSNVVLLSVLIAGFGALVEADSWRGFDNLFVPIGIHLFLANNLATPPGQLLLLAVAFTATLAAFMALAPELTLTRHAARAYTVLVFLIVSVTAPHNAILPVLAVFAHIRARLLRPCRSPYPDLDLIAGLSGTALFWLFLGEYSGVNALNVYNLTFAGAALVFLALPARRHHLLAVLAAPALCAITLLLADWNLARTHWHGLLWPWVAASLGLCLAAAWAWPGLFDRFRSPRAIAVALPVPLLLFLTSLVRSGAAPP